MGDRLRVGMPSLYVTSQLVQLSLASLRGRLIEYQLRLSLFFLSASLARLFFVILFCKVSSKSLTLRYLNLFV